MGLHYHYRALICGLPGCVTVAFIIFSQTWGLNKGKIINELMITLDIRCQIPALLDYRETGLRVMV